MAMFNSIAGQFVTFGHIDTKENVADILTKPLPKKDFYYLASKYLFRVMRHLEEEKSKERID